jgi:hypothetical protein
VKRRVERVGQNELLDGTGLGVLLGSGVRRWGGSLRG